jgi:hypothetical protein
MPKVDVLRFWELAATVPRRWRSLPPVPTVTALGHVR